jgi:hypothetical protein
MNKFDMFKASQPCLLVIAANAAILSHFVVGLPSLTNAHFLWWKSNQP